MAKTQRSEAIPLPRVANLHERTVQAAAQGEVFDRPRVQRERTVRCTTTRDEQVLPIVMAAALALANGDASRLSIISVCEVVVHNQSRVTARHSASRRVEENPAYKRGK